jgi:desulfoferrodoxin (superoxide reductase-like protein)
MLGILVIVLLTAGCLTQLISVGLIAENNTDEKQYVWIELKNKNNERMGNHDFYSNPQSTNYTMRK